ncbi:MAG: hypothetical protein ABJQ29_05500 [Luteolibacter sp.]
MLRTSLIALLSAACLHAGETRQWSNPEGTKSFDAEYVSRKGDEITLRRNASDITFDISKLHADDRKWLNLNHPVAGDAASGPIPDDDAIFDNLKFGDSRETIMEKLKASSIIEAELEETFFSRTGLNGTYRTKHKVGGLYCYLFYEWDQAGNLCEFTLRTEPQPQAQYDGSVTSCWEELPNLISQLHGAPINAGTMPSADAIKEGQMQGSHVWNIESGGSVLLGIAKIEGKYEVSVRFTLEKIKMRPTP